MINYNPTEKRGIPKIGLPKIGAPKLPLPNMFGEIAQERYEVVETDEPYLLWESGAPILWEDGTNILLEQQKIRIWRVARG